MESKAVRATIRGEYQPPVGTFTFNSAGQQLWLHSVKELSALVDE
jgi:hypothetical protein